ncbi:MAG: SMP-30/gluconolactonase/LRE family protein [Ignavibacteria bacterium]|nr:SMP-30/gluconolactonase/LRE family protein [Ignavibacteria bacterium]
MPSFQFLEDSDGELWIGTGGGGLNKMNKATGEFLRYKNDSTVKFSLSSDFVFSVDEDIPGFLLVGTQNGLDRFDKVKGEFTKYDIYPEDKEKKEAVLAFKKDLSGVIWASSYNDGLYRLSYTNNKFESFLTEKDVTCIYEDKSGRFWAGTSKNGLQMSPDKGKSFTAYVNEENNPKSLSNNHVNSIAEDFEGNLWIGTENGLNLLKKNSTEFVKYLNEPGNESSLSSSNVLKILFDREALCGSAQTGV